MGGDGLKSFIGQRGHDAATKVNLLELTAHSRQNLSNITSMSHGGMSHYAVTCIKLFVKTPLMHNS